MFCTKCGTQNAEDAMFCAKCGYALQEQVSAPVAKPRKKSPVKWIVLAVVVVILVVAAIIAVLVYDGIKSQEIIANYFEAYEDADAEKLMSYYMPEDVQEKYVEGYLEHYEDTWGLYMEEEVYWASQDRNLESQLSRIAGLEWEVIEAETIRRLNKLEKKIDEDYEVSDLDDFRDIMDDKYEDYGFDADKIYSAYAVEIKVKVEVDGETETKKYRDIIYKYGGEWYLMRGFSSSSVNYLPIH